MMLRKTIAVICAILVVLLMLPFLLFRTVANTYLNPEFYEGPILEESYERFTSFVTDKMLEDEMISNEFSIDEIRQIVYENFPKDNLRLILNEFVLQLRGMNGRRKDGAITVSLMPLKNNINDLADDISNRIISQIPLCPVDDDLQELSYDDLGLPICIPVTVDINQVRESLQHELQIELNNAIPGEFSVDLTAGADEGRTYLNQTVSIIEHLHLMLPFAILMLLLLIALLIYSPYHTIAGYIGSSLFSGGLLTLIGVQVINRIPALTVNEQNMPDLLEAELKELRSLYEVLIGFASEKMFVYSLYFMGIGAVLTLFAMYIKQYHDRSEKIA